MRKNSGKFINMPDKVSAAKYNFLQLENFKEKGKNFDNDYLVNLILCECKIVPNRFWVKCITDYNDEL